MRQGTRNYVGLERTDLQCNALCCSLLEVPASNLLRCFSQQWPGSCVSAMVERLACWRKSAVSAAVVLESAMLQQHWGGHCLEGGRGGPGFHILYGCCCCF